MTASPPRSNLKSGCRPSPPSIEAREGKALVNFGASSGHVPARMAVMHDTGDFLPRDQAAHRMATDEQRLSRSSTTSVRASTTARIGIGFGIAYVPTAIARRKFCACSSSAADRHVPVFVHMRGGTGLNRRAARLPALQEVIADAAVTGVIAPHRAHHQRRAAKHDAELPEDDRRRAASTASTSPRRCIPTPLPPRASNPRSSMAAGRSAPASNFDDLQWAATGERLTAETFAKYRKLGGVGDQLTASPEEAVARWTRESPSSCSPATAA